MPKREFTCTAKVWVYPGVGGWHFVYLPKTATQLIAQSRTKRVGFGFVPVTATIGNTTWSTTLFPSKKEGVYMLALKAAVRKKEHIFEHDTVTVTYKL